MRRPSPIVLFALLVLSPACGGDGDGVDLSGDSPDEAADEIASATCERRAECGGWDYDIETDDSDNITACTAVQDDVDVDACVAEARADFREELECVMPTEDELAQIEDCINDVVAQDCVTEEEIQAFCDAILAGEEPPEPGEAPPSCDALVEILQSCDNGGL